MSTRNKFFKISEYRVFTFGHFSRGRWTSSAEAAIKVKIGGFTRHKIAEGNGPVNALDIALRKALIRDFPQIAAVRLIDYEVHKRNGNKGTASSVVVTVTSSDGENTWITKGISSNSIEASLRAVANGLEKELAHAAKV